MMHLLYFPWLSIYLNLTVHFVSLCILFTAYDKRKYMWKLLYTQMMGYEVDFGHKQAMDLLAASG